MPTYTVKFIGRTLGAIGITYPITATVDAPDEEAALISLYDKYDSVKQPRINGRLIASRDPAQWKE